MTHKTCSLGNAFDRGAADSYYGRASAPHVRLPGFSLDVAVLADSAEGRCYLAGYRKNEELQNYKDWGDRDRDDPRMNDMGQDELRSVGITTRLGTPKLDIGCVWTEDEVGTWLSECGHAFVFIDGGPVHNEFSHCCYCGKRLFENPHDDEN